MRSTVNLVGILLVISGLAIMAGCSSNSGGGESNTGAPAVTLAPTSLTFTAQGVNTTSAGQSVTLTNSGTATLNFTGITLTGTNAADFAVTNTCGTSLGAGLACSITVTFTPTAAGARSASVSIADDASGSPQAVTLTGTGTNLMVAPTSLTLTPSTLTGNVTLTNSSSAAIAITSATITTGSSNFAVTSNSCGSSLAGNANCTITVTLTPPASGTVGGTLSIVDAAGTQTVSLTGSAVSGSNSVPVSVNFGPNGAAGGYYNGVFTSVTVCTPNTTTCQTIDNVLVDTGSVGLRILSNQLGSVVPTQINDPTTSEALYACVEYADMSYTWGPMQLVTVQLGGETASQIPNGTANAGIPVQVITVGGSAPAGADCASGGGGSDNSVALLGANGILGVGLYPQDCGTTCTGTPQSSAQYPWPYIICTAAQACLYSSASLADQAWNPVAAFSSTDTNGVLLSLNSVPQAGAASGTGTLYFGIGTQTNNQITTQTSYEVDVYGNFQQATYAGVNYNSSNSGGAFIDSGSNALYILDASTLSTASGVTTNNCADNAFYCPNSTLNLPITLTGVNGTSVTGNGNLSIANADTLFSGNQNAVFYNLGGASCVAATGFSCNASTDYLDFGAPFFLGKPIFVGIEGTNSNLPNGYWAF